MKIRTYNFRPHRFVCLCYCINELLKRDAVNNGPLQHDGGKTCKAVDGKGKEFALVIVESLIQEKTLYSICYHILKTTRLGSVKDDSVSISKLMVLRTSQSDSYPTGNP